MNQISLLQVIPVLLLLIASSSPAAGQSEIEPVTLPAELQQRYPPLDEVEVPAVSSHTLSNGLQVYFLEDHTLPIISGSALIRAGNLFDPPDKIGLAEMTGSVLRIGGTQARRGEEIDQHLENLAASVEVGIGETSGQANFWTLQQHLDTVLKTYAEVLTKPAFRQDKIDFMRQQIRSRIARRNDDPSQIAGREFQNLVYGKTSPYGWQIEYEHIDRIERADLERFYRRYFFPANIILGVYGDFSTEEMKAKLEAAFQDWTSVQRPVPAFPAVKRDPSGGLYLVAKQDVNQSNIRIGHLGGILRDEDYPALEVMGSILGGGFQSRLFQQVRSNLGLAYHASASWGANYDHPGVFRVSLGTKSESTLTAIRATLAEIKRIREAPVTAQELRSAKEAVLNSFVFNFDTKRKILGRLLVYRYWDYPQDFIFRYREKIRAVSADDVLRVARQHLQPDQMKLLVVGNPAEFGEPLDALGQALTVVDISIPEPEQQLAGMDESSLSKGREILAQAQQASGGVERLATVKDITIQAKLQGMGGTMSADQTTQLILPDVFRQENQLPFGKVIVYVRGDAGWMQTPQGRMPLPAPQLDQAQNALFRARVPLLLSDRNTNRSINFVEPDELNGQPAGVIEIASEGGPSVRLWVDSTAGDVLKSAYQGATMGGSPSEVEELYSDYREINGLRLPFKTAIFQNGRLFMEVSVEEMRFNTGLDPSALAQP